MSFRAVQRLAVGLLIGGCVAGSAGSAWGQEEVTRKVKIKIAPSYPELAKRMSIRGVVRVQVTVSPNGTVKEVTLIGGHPVLANAALDAVKKWRYEARNQETTAIVEFRFDPTE